MLITAPSDHETQYAMSVRLARAELVALPAYSLHPWLTVRVDDAAGQTYVSAGVKAKKEKL